MLKNLLGAGVSGLPGRVVALTFFKATNSFSAQGRRESSSSYLTGRQREGLSGHGHLFPRRCTKASQPCL